MHEGSLLDSRPAAHLAARRSGIAVATTSTRATAHAYTPTARSPLVTIPWLAEHLTDPAVVIVDARWYLKGARGADAYQKGHLPGAHFFEMDGELASPPGPGRPGRHPLPEVDAFARALERAGVGPESVVVAYDDAGGSVAARVWWLLRYFGHDIGRVLDGGIQAWIAAGHPLETTVPNAHTGRDSRCPRALSSS